MAGAASAQAQTTYQYQRLSRGLSVTPPAPTTEGILSLSTATLGAATVGGSYSVDFTKYLAVSGLSNYTASSWSVSAGTLPPGLSLSTAGQLHFNGESLFYQHY